MVFTMILLLEGVPLYIWKEELKVIQIRAVKLTQTTIETPEVKVIATECFTNLQVVVRILITAKILSFSNKVVSTIQ